MRRSVLVLALLTSVLPIPARSEAKGDAVMLDSPRDLATKLTGIADGSVRLIHLAAAPEAASESQPAPVRTPARLPQRPPHRPAIMVANSCGWNDAPAATARLRAAVAGPLWLLEPATSTCDAAAITAAAEQAAGAPDGDRLAMLLAAGLRLSEADPAPLAAPLAAPVAGAAVPPVLPGSLPAGTAAAPLSGKLVITALPAGASLTGAPAAVIRPSAASAAPALSPAAPEAPPESLPDPASAAPRAVAVSMARRPGQPEPAIIVGELASLIGPANRGPLGTPREVRDRIRQIDIAFFELMLKEGRFDPAEGQYAAAIQTELSQMDCYDGSVDGSWGNGSLAALRRYFSTLGQAEAGTVPGPDLYRRIATNDRVRCPAAQRVSVPRNEAAPTRNTAGTPPRNTGTRATGTRNNGTRGATGQAAATRPAQTQPQTQTQTPRRQPAQAATPPRGAPAGTAPRINPDLVNSLGSGVIK